MRGPITSVILAGGQGSRIGGNKGLRTLHGRPLIEWVLDSIRRQSDEVLISANESGDEYARLGCTVIADQTPDWLGPLAGLQSALRCARHDLVACVPCDTPYLPKDLLARLAAAMENAEVAVAMVESRRQPTIALYRIKVLQGLDAYLAGGGRKVSSWLDTLKVREVVFDDAAAFININSSEELESANQRRP